MVHIYRDSTQVPESTFPRGCDVLHRGDSRWIVQHLVFGRPSSVMCRKTEFALGRVSNRVQGDVSSPGDRTLRHRLWHQQRCEPSQPHAAGSCICSLSFG